MLKAGFASRCITPALGKEIPGLFERRFAQGVHDELHARATVLDDGAACVALVQTDSIKVGKTLVSEARKAAQRLCGIPGRNCFIAATHTHSGGPIFGGFLACEDAQYQTHVSKQIAAAIAEAYRLRRPALVGVEAARAEGFAFNRRFLMKDGSQRTHPGKMHPEIQAPAGPADPTVTVVSCCDPATWKSFGTVVSFACHGTHMNGVLYSADYPKWIVDTLQAVYGPEFGVTFLNGACGDVTQVNNQSARPDEFGPYWCERMGRGVAGAAIQALARTDYYRGATLSVEKTSVRAAIRKSSVAERRAARALLAKHEITPANIETIYANELLEVEALRRRTPVLTLEIMGVRIADALFWGVPGEFFQALALEVRDASPFPNTCCVELANDYAGYICTAAAFGGGGYEIRTARSSLLESDTGERIVRAGKRLVKRMYATAEREVRALPRRKCWPAYADNAALDGIKQLTKK